MSLGCIGQKGLLATTELSAFGSWNQPKALWKQMGSLGSNKTWFVGNEMWLTGSSLQTPVLSSFDIGNPNHFFGSGKTTAVCCRTSTWLLPLATAKHPVEEEFSFISQMLPFLKPAASMMQQKTSKLLIAYACASWVSQTPNVIITAWLQCNSSRPICVAI